MRVSMLLEQSATPVLTPNKEVKCLLYADDLDLRSPHRGRVAAASGSAGAILPELGHDSKLPTKLSSSKRKPDVK